MALEIILVCGLIYCAADLVLGVVFRRCLLPGLRCPACRRGGRH